MTTSENTSPQDITEQDNLSARWDKVAFHAQGSPLEDLSITCLAKNSASRPWSRSYSRVKGDSLERYIYLSFEELQAVEQLDLKTAIHLLEICEATLLFETECNDLANFENLDEQAEAQHKRFLDKFGLYGDYPVALSNLDADFLELCQAEEVVTLIDLMGFIDRLSDKAWIGGGYQSLQNIFAHGDEKGLCKYFPYRMRHRGFHLPEAISLCLDRLPQNDLQSVFDYYDQRHQKTRFGRKRAELPTVVEIRLLLEMLRCLHYFGRRQPKLLVHLHDSAYLSRELMFLNNPKTEDIICWLLHLALGLFRPYLHREMNEEIKQISVDKDTDLYRDLEQIDKET
jgi:hypothetical protein